MPASSGGVLGSREAPARSRVAPAAVGQRVLKGLTILGLLSGLTLGTLLVLAQGAGVIWHSATALGWVGFSLVLGVRLGLIASRGTGWWLLGLGRADSIWVRFVWGRLIRDSASEALPLSQIGGYLFGARALTLSGVASSFAAASTVVDVTVELVAQLGYVLLGLALLYGFRPGSTPIAPILGCVGLMGALVSLFVAVQARGAGLAEKAWARMAHELLGREIIRSSTIQTEIRAIHSESATLALAATIHLTTWVWGGAETWLTLRLMGVPLPFSAALVIDSLLYGARSIAFMVPNAFGVQEGALVLLGSLFGVGPDTALALSFIKRGRDLIIGIPALLVWQAIEGRRAWREQAIDPGKASAE